MKKSILLVFLGAVNIIIAMIKLIPSISVEKDEYGMSFGMNIYSMIWLVSSIIFLCVGIYMIVEERKSIK